MKISIKYLILITGNFFVNMAYGQSLCDRTDLEKGDFNLSSEIVCLPNQLNVSDISGGTDIKYLFNYTTESFEEARSKSQNISSFDYTSLASRTQKFTIVQTGFKNNKPMVACKDVWVRKGNQPVFSYNYCNFGSLNLTIPDLPINDFDSYILNLPSIGLSENISKSQIPFTKNYLYAPVGATLSIIGLYNDPTKNCSTLPQIVNIPNPDFVNGAAYTYFPNINSVELIGNNQVSLRYTGPFSVSNNPDEQYNLFMFPKNSPVSFNTPIETNLQTGTYKVNVPDETKSYCFMVQKRINHCNNTQPERSAVICTQPLFSLDFTPTRNTLTFDAYPINYLINNTPGVTYRSIIKRAQITVDNNISIVSNSIPSNQIIFNHNNIDCKKEHCYRVVINQETRINSFLSPVATKGVSISNQMCFDASKQKPDPLSDISVSTENQKNVIRVKNNTTWDIPVNKVFLEKKDNQTYKIVDSVALNIGVLNDTNTVTKSETFRVIFRDNCNAISLPSDSVQNIFLDYRNSNELFWTKESPYSLVDFDKYKIYYLDEDLLIPVDSAEQSDNLRTFVANLSSYNFKAKMKVASVSAEANPRYSFSNLIEIPIKQNLILPEVFTPNADNQNDILDIYKLNPNALDITMEIFDRNGGKLFEINKNIKEWDGTINGKSLPIGTYIYRIKAIYPNNEIFDKKGVIEILK